MIVVYDDINLPTNRFLTLQDDKGIAAVLMPRVTHEQAQAMAEAATSKATVQFRLADKNGNILTDETGDEWILNSLEDARREKPHAAAFHELDYGEITIIKETTEVVE